MAVPKRRTSKARRNKRRAHWKLNIPRLVICPNCRQQHLPHHACPYCGYYKGREIYQPKERKEE
ncbi:MAG TPA: 50S ribosomal protein L32 [Armatimonadetes bacterium]|nr:50S ribosomal protein L32 [Armatimonadota bacterium]